MRRWLGVIVLLCLVASRAKAEDPEKKVYALTDYLKGTPSQIRTSLYKEIIRITRVSRETHRQLTDAQSELAKDTAAVIAQVHGQPEYKSLSAELQQAKHELEQARAGGSTEDRMAASSKLNRIKASIDALEKSALREDHTVAADQKRVTEFTAEAAGQKKSLDKAEEWKDRLCNAVEFPMKLHWPLRIGDRGFLGDVMVWDLTEDGFTIPYDAYEVTSEGHNAEGIVDLNGVHHEVGMLIEGVDTKGLKGGSTINLDRMFVIAKKKAVANGYLFVVKPAPAPEDFLWKKMSADPTDEEINAGAAK
jgi:hypothetical protein